MDGRGQAEIFARQLLPKSGILMAACCIHLQGQRTGPRTGGKEARLGGILTETWDQSCAYVLERETEKSSGVIMGLLP